MPFYWVLAGIIEVILFYSLSVEWGRKWKNVSSSVFERNAFSSALVLRLMWIVGYYLFTMEVWQTPWEQPVGTSMDSTGYYQEAMWLYEMILAGDITPYLQYIATSGSFSDAGYPVFLAVSNLLFHNSILLTRVPNAFFDAWTVVLTYRIAKRNFGESVGRTSALFVILMPMVIFYSGVTMKESLMLMLTMWAVERGDYVIREKRFNVGSLAAFISLSVMVTLLRVALAWVIILSFFCALAFSSERLLNYSKRLVIILALLFVGAAFFGSAILEQSEELIEQSEATGANFEFRANRRGGNVLVSRLNKVVLVPLLVTIPFPTMVDIDGQNIQQLQNGGFYIKNILSFFCFLALLSFLPKNRWKNHVMIIAFFLGYLAALGLSSFAHSGRFHHPIIPIEMIFGALGISQIKNIKQVRWFDYFLVLELCIIVFWNWFKLRGRGMV